MIPTDSSVKPQPKQSTQSPARNSRWRHPFWEWRAIWLTPPIVTGLVWLVQWTGLLQAIEWAVFDQNLRWRPAEVRDPAIVIVGIGEADIRALGTWPMSDAVLAKLLTAVKQQRPRAIGLDLYRDLPVGSGNAALKRIYQTTPNLIGIEKVIGSEADPAIAPPPILKQNGQTSANDVVADADGKIRRGFLILQDAAGNWIESLGLKLALFHLDAQGMAPTPDAPHLALGRTIFRPFRANDGAYVRADDGGEQVMINFRGPARSFETVSMRAVMAGQIPPNLLRDRLVFIGPTAPSLKDFFYTPYSSTWTGSPEQMAGVEIQANLASHIIHAAQHGRPLIHSWSDSLEVGWLFLWTSLATLVGWASRSTRWNPAIALFGTGILIGSGIWAMRGGLWIPVVPPVMGLLGSLGIITWYRAEVERRDRKLLMNLFGRHVAPEVAEAVWRDRHQILTEGRVSGQCITATVLFTDIQNFTRMAEQTDPAVLMEWLNEYMSAMAQVVLENGGIVDKFIGDAVMAVFGVPIPSLTPDAIAEDAQHAVTCARMMAKTLQFLNQRWESQQRPTVGMRIGIATGTVVIGSLGSQQRLEYTTIGDSVNVAARLESYELPGQGKSVANGCRILISENTYQLLRSPQSIQEIGSVMLKGRTQPMKIYQVLSDEPNREL